MSQKVWFITGASRGFGRLWTEAALRRGDKVVATARNTEPLEALVTEFGESVLPLSLDVTNHARVAAAVDKAHQHFGRLDIVLSNAGYGLMGAIEETSIEDSRVIFETNVLGTLSVAQAALPHMRAQGNGHILLVSSVAGLVTFPLAGIYQATKYAVEGLGQTLAQEVAEFGIKVTLVEPGPYKTDFMSEASIKHANELSAYDPMRKKFATLLTPDMFGEPAATVDALFKLVDSEQPPTQFILGELLPLVRQDYEARLKQWSDWEPISKQAKGN